MAERVAVVVPSRGLDGLLAVCLRHARRSLERAGAVGAITVVDNASPVPYAAADLPDADRIVRFDAHRSFSEACNAGAAGGAFDHLLLLNNDVLLHEEALSGMLALVAEPLTAVCGTRMVYPDGTIQHCGVVFTHGGPFHDHARRPTQTVPRTPRLLQCATGAALLIRRDAWDAVGGLCEDYPYGYEDVDLCLRIRQLGYRIACAQAVDSIHFESQTEGRAERDIPSRRIFLDRWPGRWSVDTDEAPHAG